jgi:A2L zinc ribbon domain
MTTLRPVGGPLRGLYHACPAERCPSCGSTMILTEPDHWFCQFCGATKITEPDSSGDAPADKSNHQTP